MLLKMTLSNVPSSTTHIAITSLFLQPFYKSFRLKNGPKLAKFRNLTLKYDLGGLFDLEDDLRCYWKWHYRTRRPQKTRYRYLRRISSPSRSHSSSRLKLMLQTQVTNPKVATFQSFSKGVYAMGGLFMDGGSNGAISGCIRPPFCKFIWPYLSTAFSDSRYVCTP